MSGTSYLIDSTYIKRPSKFSIDRYFLTNLERTTAGLMQGDYIAKKQKFSFTYDFITAADLNNILSLLWETTELFHSLIYIENNVQKTATVYVGNIPSDLYMPGANWVWKNVTFSLIEQ